MRLFVPTFARGLVAAISLLAAIAAAISPMPPKSSSTSTIGCREAIRPCPSTRVQKGLFAKEGLDVTVQSARGSSEAITRIATGVGGCRLRSAGGPALRQGTERGSGDVGDVGIPDAAGRAVHGRGIEHQNAEGRRGKARRHRDLHGVQRDLATDPEGERRRREQGHAAEGRSRRAGPHAGNRPGRRDDQLVDGVARLRQSARGGREEAEDHSWADYGYEGYGYSVFASDKAIAQRPETIGKFVKVMREAAAMAPADPAGVAAAMKAAFPEIDPRPDRSADSDHRAADRQSDQQGGRPRDVRQSPACENLGMDRQGSEHPTRQARPGKSGYPRFPQLVCRI